MTSLPNLGHLFTTAFKWLLGTDGPYIAGLADDCGWDLRPARPSDGGEVGLVVLVERETGIEAGPMTLAGAEQLLEAIETKQQVHSACR